MRKCNFESIKGYDIAFRRFYDVLHLYLEKIFPLNLLDINKLRPQFSNATMKLRTKTKKSFKKLKASKNSSDYLKFKKERVQYKTQLKTFYRKQNLNFFQNSIGDSKCVHKKINTFMGKDKFKERLPR